MGMRIGWVGQRAELALQVATVAAAAGAEVVPGPVGDCRKCALLLVDAHDAPERVPAPAPPDAGAGSDPLGPPIVVVHLHGEVEPALRRAEAIGASHVVELPHGVEWLAAQVRADDPSALVGVLGAVGGAGASTLAIACAVAAGPGCLLVDADPGSVGLDLALGIGEDAGGRWPAIPDTTEPLVADSLRAALPVVGGVSVVTGTLPSPVGGRVDGVVDVGRRAFARTVVDCGREPGAIRWRSGDVAVVVTPATLGGVVGARRLLDRLPNGRVVLAVRPTAWLSARDVVDQLGGVPHLVVPRLPRVAELADCADVLSGRIGRALVRLGTRVWEAAA